MKLAGFVNGQGNTNGDRAHFFYLSFLFLLSVLMTDKFLVFRLFVLINCPLQSSVSVYVADFPILFAALASLFVHCTPPFSLCYILCVMFVSTPARPCPNNPTLLLISNKRVVCQNLDFPPPLSLQFSSAHSSSKEPSRNEKGSDSFHGHCPIWITKAVKRSSC
jgi:hypothetical protein